MKLHICCIVNVVFFLKCKVTMCAYSVCGMLEELANEALVTLRLKYLFCIPIGTKKDTVKYKCLAIKLHLK